MLTKQNSKKLVHFRRISLPVILHLKEKLILGVCSFLEAPHSQKKHGNKEDLNVSDDESEAKL